MKKEFVEEECINSMVEYIPVLREHAGLAVKPMSAHLRVAYDTYLNLRIDHLELEYVGYKKDTIYSITRKFSKTGFMTEQKIKEHVKNLMAKVAKSAKS